MVSVPLSPAAFKGGAGTVKAAAPEAQEAPVAEATEEEKKKD